jgi:hypothetical protein
MGLPARTYVVKSPEQDRAMIVHALTLFNKAVKNARSLGEKVGSFHWVTQKNRHLLKYLHEQLARTVEIIEVVERDFERASPEERQQLELRVDGALLEWLDPQLQLLEELYKDWEKAFSGDPIYKQLVDTWDPAFSPKLFDEALEHLGQRFNTVLKGSKNKIPGIRERIKEAYTRIESISNHHHVQIYDLKERQPHQETRNEEQVNIDYLEKQRTDRRAVIKSLGAGASLILTASLLKKIASGKSVEQELPPLFTPPEQQVRERIRELPAIGVHLQFAADKIEGRAIQAAETLTKELALLNVKEEHLHIFVHKDIDSEGNPIGTYPFKLLTREIWGTGEEAVEAATDYVIELIPQLDSRWQKVGIVTVNEQGSIAWEGLSSRVRKRYQLDEDVGVPADHEARLEAFLSSVRQAVRTYPIITRTGKHLTIDERLVWAIITTESSFNHKAVSPVGAMGLMQVMPLIWRHFHGRSSLFPHNKVKGVPVIKEQQLVPIPNSQGTHVCMPSDYRQNIDCGVAYLSELFRKARNEQWPRYWKGTGLPDYGEEVFDGFDFVIMAYNAGETRIRRFLRGKLDHLPSETVNYLEKVRKEYERLRGLGNRVNVRQANNHYFGKLA